MDWNLMIIAALHVVLAGVWFLIGSSVGYLAGRKDAEDRYLAQRREN